MLSVWTLLSTAICAVSASAISQRLVYHGHLLTLDLPERTQKLEFVNANESERLTIWEHTNSFRPSNPNKGYVSSVGKGWTFRIQRVTFDDEGSYTLFNHFGSAISSYIVKVKPNREFIDRIAGETLTIPLAGLKQGDAKLHFYSNYSSLILVESGVPVGRNLPEYTNRLKVTTENIQILKVNVSDLGRYELTDHKGRLVSNSTLMLVDHRDYSANKGLLALLLLGIPGGICFCCRKRICKSCRSTKSDTNTGQLNTVPVSVPCSSTMSDPVGPGNTGQGFYSDYQNPVYPPAFGPGHPPAQPPQYNAPPTHYNPPAPVVHPKPFANLFAFHPVGFYFYVLSQPSDRTGISMDILNASDSGVQFDVNKGKSSGSNFL
uniref:Wu:fc21g02 n=1 Tax=Cyprinus carpio TaxID=7962 RepID=A0A8C2JX50_CYPCA